MKRKHKLERALLAMYLDFERTAVSGHCIFGGTEPGWAFDDRIWKTQDRADFALARPVRALLGLKPFSYRGSTGSGAGQAWRVFRAAAARSPLVLRSRSRGARHLEADGEGKIQMNGNVATEMQAWQAYKRYVRMKMNVRRRNTPGSNAEFLGDEISAQLFAEWQPLYRKRIGLSRVQRERAKLH